MKMNKNESYSYLYHISPHREDSEQWACIHRDDMTYYFNGNRSGKFTPPNNSPRIGFGNTPEKAFERVILIEKSQ